MSNNPTTTTDAQILLASLRDCSQELLTQAERLLKLHEQIEKSQLDQKRLASTPLLSAEPYSPFSGRTLPLLPNTNG